MAIQVIGMQNAHHQQFKPCPLSINYTLGTVIKKFGVLLKKLHCSLKKCKNQMSHGLIFHSCLFYTFYLAIFNVCGCASIYCCYQYMLSLLNKQVPLLAIYDYYLVCPYANQPYVFTSPINRITASYQVWLLGCLFYLWHMVLCERFDMFWEDVL